MSTEQIVEGDQVLEVKDGETISEKSYQRVTQGLDVAAHKNPNITEEGKQVSLFLSPTSKIARRGLFRHRHRRHS